jgi:hypothetical protein
VLSRITVQYSIVEFWHERGSGKFCRCFDLLYCFCLWYFVLPSVFINVFEHRWLNGVYAGWVEYPSYGLPRSSLGEAGEGPSVSSQGGRSLVFSLWMGMTQSVRSASNLDITRLSLPVATSCATTLAYQQQSQARPQNAKSNDLSVPGDCHSSAPAGARTTNARFGPSAFGHVSWLTYPHRFPPRRPSALGGPFGPPRPTSVVITSCSTDPELEVVLGRQLVTSRCLVGTRPFRRPGTQVRVLLIQYVRELMDPQILSSFRNSICTIVFQTTASAKLHVAAHHGSIHSGGSERSCLPTFPPSTGSDPPDISLPLQSPLSRSLSRVCDRHYSLLLRYLPHLRARSARSLRHDRLDLPRTLRAPFACRSLA